MSLSDDFLQGDETKPVSLREMKFEMMMVGVGIIVIMMMIMAMMM